MSFLDGRDPRNNSPHANGTAWPLSGNFYFCNFDHALSLLEDSGIESSSMILAGGLFASETHSHCARLWVVIWQ